jgi:hypothetical protein
MDIYIDDNMLDVSLEAEQTVGDLFVSLEKWLSDTGFRFTAFQLDGKNIPASEVEKAFSTNLHEVARIDVKTTSATQLYAESLLDAAFFLNKYTVTDTGGNGDGGNNEIADEWKESGGRSFLIGDHPGFAHKIDDYLLWGRGDGQRLNEEIVERLHEIANPEAVLLSMKEKIYDITARLEVFSLNMQMGKDREASETVFMFSQTAEKLFRIIPLMHVVANDAELRAFFEEFIGVLKEFFAAYKAQDSVLAGDLAEYEVSPRLIELYDRLKEKNDSAVSAKPADESIAKAC